MKRELLIILLMLTDVFGGGWSQMCGPAMAAGGVNYLQQVALCGTGEARVTV